MFKRGSIVFGLFTLPDCKRNKYAIILNNDGNGYLLTTFTTSKDRAGVNPVHGANPDKDHPNCYVFKAHTIIGKKPDNTDFAFPLDTVIVPDYGYSTISIEDFNKKVENLTKVCDLYKEEFTELIYIIYKSKYLKSKHKKILETVLIELHT